MKRNIAIFNNDATDEEIAEYIRSRAGVKKHAQHDQKTHGPKKAPDSEDDWSSWRRGAILRKVRNPATSGKPRHVSDEEWREYEREYPRSGVGDLYMLTDARRTKRQGKPYLRIGVVPIHPKSEVDKGGVTDWDLYEIVTEAPDKELNGQELWGYLDSIRGNPNPVSKSIDIAKMDSRKNVVFGWANVAMTPDGQVEDHQGHLIDIEDLEDAAYNFVVKYRVTGDMHEGDAFGELVESVVITEDKIEKAGFPADRLGHWWVGFRVPPEHWDAVERGDRAMFSIQGKARLEPTD